jgi:hypothetical protein
MGVLALMDQARAAGLSLAVHDGRLVIEGPKSAAPLAQALGLRKSEVIAALTEPAPEPASASPPDPGPPCRPPYPWRAELPRWPIPWREAWGRRANELQDRGLRWWEAEQQAQAEVARLKDSGELPPDATVGMILAAIGKMFPIDVS